MKFHHSAINVSNLERSIAFYVTFFDYEEVKRFERSDLGGRAVFLRLGDMHLELWEFRELNKNDGDDNSTLQRIGIRHIAFAVDNIEEECERLRSNGIEVGEPRKGASGGMYAFLSDPDSIQIELYQALS